jgi:hypothetical protein
VYLYEIIGGSLYASHDEIMTEKKTDSTGLAHQKVPHIQVHSSSVLVSVS